MDSPVSRLNRNQVIAVALSLVGVLWLTGWHVVGLGDGFQVEEVILTLIFFFL